MVGIVSPVVMSVINRNIILTNIAVTQFSKALFDFESATWSEEARSLAVVVAGVVINGGEVASASVGIAVVDHLNGVVVSKRHALL